MARRQRTTRLPPSVVATPDPVADPVLADGDELADAAVTGDLSFVVASHVEVVGCRVEATLTGASLGSARLVDVVVANSDLSGATLERLSATRVEFRACRMSGLVVDLAHFDDVAFVDCRLDGANLRMTTWGRSELVDCDLRDADLSGATLGGARLTSCDLRGADVSGADLAGVRLHGSRLDDLRGADALRGATLGSDQLVPAAVAVFAALGIAVDDDPDGG